MGNAKSKKIQKEPTKFFEREKWKEQRRDELRKKQAHPANKRVGSKEHPAAALAAGAAGAGGLAPALPVPPGLLPPAARSYDAEALDRMRFQLNNDADAFLLNNILLSVQFFENYEREVQHIKANPINEREHTIDEAMVHHHKHVFFADRLQESVHEHVRLRATRAHAEPLAPPRLFIIYDNVEACEPGDTSDYSTVLDAPFYKLVIEDCKEPGYMKLKKLEVLESTIKKNEIDDDGEESNKLDDSLYTDSDRESNYSDDLSRATKGEDLLDAIKNKLKECKVTDQVFTPTVTNLNDKIDVSGRRSSGPLKQFSAQAKMSNISNIKNIRSRNVPLTEENKNMIRENESEVTENKARKSILKNVIGRNFLAKEPKPVSHMPTDRVSAENSQADDTETSGYRSNETDSDYGYSTITDSATPKKVELSGYSNVTATSGVLPEECWSTVQVKTVDSWSDDEEYDDEVDNTSKETVFKNLFESHYYLNSVKFMKNFIDNFMVKLGIGLEISQDSINNALTQGASIYCESTKNDAKINYEVIPAIIAAWPNAGNQWIIRERRIIQNPRTNFSYQWPTRYMVSKAIGFGCLLVPIGYRPKRGSNPDQKLQWRILFPAAERYLESCLAHSHIRCYLFALILQRTFMDVDKSRVGIDASHIKNHLFWQCEDNYAKWPEDRLGETLRLFLKSFYLHFGYGKFPNYFMDGCNDFKSIPKPVLLKIQRRLADILEAPVMHILKAISKIKYTKKDFYPVFNVNRLYQILVCKNPIRLLNPHLMPSQTVRIDSTDTEEEDDNSKAYDKHYLWKKERQKQIHQRRRFINQKKQKNAATKTEIDINTKIILPKKLDPERRQLVLELFIPHFIAMARSSERFSSIRQAVIYLEQSQRLATLLLEISVDKDSANDYLDVIRDKLADCHRKLASQGGFKLPPRSDSSKNNMQLQIRKKRPKYQNIINQDSPTDTGVQSFTFVDVHVEAPSTDNRPKDSVNVKTGMELEEDEESKL